jgi:hypothetical protein
MSFHTNYFNKIDGASPSVSSSTREFHDDDELNRRLTLAVTNSYTNSGTPISSSSSASDALCELNENDNDDELEHRLTLAVANADAHENASLAGKVPGAWPADSAADDDLLDLSDEEDDDEEDTDDDEEEQETPVPAALSDDEDDEDDEDDLNRRLALAVANGNALAASEQKHHQKQRAAMANDKKRARAEDAEEEEEGYPNVAKKTKVCSWLPDSAFVDNYTVPIHPGTNAAERMWWERYAARKGMVYHHDVFMCGQRPGDVL